MGERSRTLTVPHMHISERAAHLALERPGRAAARVLSAAMAFATTPDTLAVGTKPLACSAARMEVPVREKRARLSESGMRDVAE